MQNADQWKPSKYVLHNGRLRANRDAREVGVASRLIVDLIAEFYQRALPEFARGRLLDLGCGKVPLYMVYRDRVDEITCVDWANTAHKNPHLDMECDLTQPLVFADSSFDTIILSDVLEHLPEPELLWREMARALAPGGRIIMNVPFYYWLHEQPHDFYRYTEFALRRFVERSGLELLRLEPRGGAPEILADVFAKNAQRIPRAGRPLAAMTQAVAGWFVQTNLGRKVSSATSRSFPFFYTLVAEKPKP